MKSTFDQLFEAYVTGHQNNPADYAGTNDDKNSFGGKDRIPTTQPSGSKFSFTPSEGNEEVSSQVNALRKYLDQLKLQHKDPNCQLIINKIVTFLNTQK